MAQCRSQLRPTTSHRLRAVIARQMLVNELRDESFVDPAHSADGTPTVKNVRNTRGRGHFTICPKSYANVGPLLEDGLW
jgi:hypothetical protein